MFCQLQHSKLGCDWLNKKYWAQLRKDSRLFSFINKSWKVIPENMVFGISHTFERGGPIVYFRKLTVKSGPVSSLGKDLCFWQLGRSDGKYLLWIKVSAALLTETLHTLHLQNESAAILTGIPLFTMENMEMYIRLRIVGQCASIYGNTDKFGRIRGLPWYHPKLTKI